jgi:hypothetical protein
MADRRAVQADSGSFLATEPWSGVELLRVSVCVYLEQKQLRRPLWQYEAKKRAKRENNGHSPPLHENTTLAITSASTNQASGLDIFYSGKLGSDFHGLPSISVLSAAQIGLPPMQTLKP